MTTEITPLQQQVRRLVGDMSPVGKREAQPTDRLVEDLGYDSLAVIELSLQMEEAFGLAASSGTEVDSDVTTVGDLEAFIAARVTAPA